MNTVGQVTGGEYDLAAAKRALAIGPHSTRAERTIDVTRTGRRSGEPRRIEIWFHHVDGHWLRLPRGRWASLR
jgi:hypothetical protein